ncbi:MAG: glycosyltransferase family 2 protein [Desulfitobacteriaceae bacterium]
MCLCKMQVSVLIPTKNEERNISECIKSVSWADEVFVLDSYSSDRTLEICREMGVNVVQRVFEDFATHKNWALQNLPFRNEWILIIDADERITEQLSDEIKSVLSRHSNHQGYYIARKNFFMGKWVRHGGWYPNWNLRLFKRDFARYEQRIVHEHIVLQGKPGYLKHPLIHNDFKGLERYFDRHNTYSSMEAIEASRAMRKMDAEHTLRPNLFSRGPERRRFLKELAYRYLPGRPVFKFVWMYFFQLGFLDGAIGFRYCLLHAFYEYQVSLKLKELSSGTGSPLYQKYRNMIERNYP